jgi:predicted branched-subunit amino acid permease
LDLTQRIGRWHDTAAATMRRPMFRQGVVDCRPLAIGIAAWGLVAGVATAKSGMGIPLAILMSVLVSAGSSQIAALPLIVADAPMWVVWATVACVNLRFLVFSFQYRPYFGHLPRGRRVLLSYFMGDTIFAIFLRRFPEPKHEPGQEDYFWGASVINWGAWQVAVVVGIAWPGTRCRLNGAWASPAPWRCWRSPARSCAIARRGWPRWSPRVPQSPPTACPCD